MEKTKKLLMLENLLKQKMEKLDELHKSHFKDIILANFQPLNDNVMSRLDSQRQSIRILGRDIERTQKAIDIETDKILDRDIANLMMLDKHLEMAKDVEDELSR